MSDEPNQRTLSDEFYKAMADEIVHSPMKPDIEPKLKELLAGRHGLEYIIMEIACEHLSDFRKALQQIGYPYIEPDYVTEAERSEYWKDQAIQSRLQARKALMRNI